MEAVNSGIVFTEQFYYPEGWGGAQLPRDLTIHLVRSGYGVEVICGSEQYEAQCDEPLEDPGREGVKISRLPRLLGGHVHRYRLIRQLWFYLMAFPRLLFRRRPALFITQTNPPLLVPMVAMVAAVLRAPFIVIAQDLYPEVVLAHGMIREGNLLSRWLNCLFRWAYRRAARVVALGPKMLERLQVKGVAPERIVTISNWATGDEGVVRGEHNELRRDWRLESKFVLLYSGNIGLAHDIETPLHALAQAVIRCPDLRLVIVGKGQRLNDARHMTDRLSLNEYVQFRPLVRTKLLPQSLGLADIALVTLRAGFEGLVVPSKLLGYMARGIPTIYVGPPGDVQALLEDSAGGVSVRNGESAELARCIVEMASNPLRLAAAGRAAAVYYRSHLSREIALARYLELIRSTARIPHSPM